MELYVVRHGQTDYNVKHIFQGHADIPLNQVGIQQAKETASKFQNIAVDEILVSPLQRAIQTASFISEVTNVKPVIEKRLIERSFGDMEGKPSRPDWNIQMMLDYEKNYNYENIEPIQSLFKRIYDFLDDITQKYKDKSVVLVTHGGVSQPVECYFHGMPSVCDFEHLELLTLKYCEVRKYTQRKIEREREGSER